MVERRLEENLGNETENNENGYRTAIFDAQPAVVRVVRSFWRINPFTVFGVAILLGLLPLIYAAFSGSIGSITYDIMPGVADAVPCPPEYISAGTCNKKQVGYNFAINWAPTLVALMPLTLFFAFSSVQSMQHVFARMLKHNMFCDAAWQNTQTTIKGLRNLVRKTWIVFTVSGLLVSLFVFLLFF
jgi:hypothetical protein